MPSSLQARITRTAISPRLAMRTLVIAPGSSVASGATSGSATAAVARRTVAVRRESEARCAEDETRAEAARRPTAGEQATAARAATRAATRGVDPTYETCGSSDEASEEHEGTTTNARERRQNADPGPTPHEARTDRCDSARGALKGRHLGGFLTERGPMRCRQGAGKELAAIRRANGQSCGA